ncbi:MAG: phosphocholine cytidylyltransferase family protein [Parachlamydiales bacterium]
MQIIILAAGKGSRLGNLAYPKALTPLANGETILGRQIRQIQKLIPETLIHIVVGYRKELIIEQYDKLNFIINDSFATENTAKSLLRALKPSQGDILWMNGDVVFHSEALETLLNTGPTAMLVNIGRVAEEEVKYRLNDNGDIAETSKEVQNPVGEAVGINYFNEKDARLLQAALINCKQNDYFEKGIEVCIQNGMQIHPATIPYDRCVEIDFPTDLDRANQLLAQWE